MNNLLHRDCPGIPIIAMTAQYTFDKKDTTMKDGASHFLGKPFTIEQVYNSLKSKQRVVEVR